MIIRYVDHFGPFCIIIVLVNKIPRKPLLNQKVFYKANLSGIW